MSRKVKSIASFLFISLSIAAVVVIAFSNKELRNAWQVMGQVNLLWLGGVFLCWVVYTFFDGMNYWCYLNAQGFKISIGRAVNVALIGFYYSNITPGAAGGQPMQVNSFRKAGIPIGYGTMAVTIRFITNQFMISLISLVLFLVNREFVYQQLGGVIWAARIGWLINFAAVPVVILAAFKRNWVQGLANWIIGLLSKIHLIRNPEIAIAKVTDVLDTYQVALNDLCRKPAQILIQLLCSTVSLLGLTGSVVFVYYAFGQSGTPWHRILCMSCLLFVSASYTPLPGASGAQEGGFLVYFKGIFKDGTIGLALLVWRFFTFYLFLIVGVFTVLLEKIILKKEEKKKARIESEEAGDAEKAGETGESGEAGKSRETGETGETGDDEEAGKAGEA